MNILLYFTQFFMLLLAGGLVINGWFAVTRGEWEDEVDGTRKKTGKLLKGWWFFWFKERSTPKYTKYKGEAFMRLMDNIRKQKAFDKFQIMDRDDDYITAKFTIESLHARVLFKDYFDVVPGTFADMGDRRMVDFSKEEPNYVFPTWLRTMMAGCITCFSSFWGSLIFWSFYLLIGRGWFAELNTDYPLTLLIATWIAYMLALAYVNTRLWTRMDRQ